MTILRIARINTTFTNAYGHHPLVNLEIWDHVPADETVNGQTFTFRQVDHLDATGASNSQNLYQYPVGTSCSVDLGTPDQYFDMSGNAVSLQAVS
jgi:hypothetical protein